MTIVMDRNITCTTLVFCCFLLVLYNFGLGDKNGYELVNCSYCIAWSFMFDLQLNRPIWTQAYISSILLFSSGILRGFQDYHIIRFFTPQINVFFIRTIPKHIEHSVQPPSTTWLNPFISHNLFPPPSSLQKKNKGKLPCHHLWPFLQVWTKLDTAAGGVLVVEGNERHGCPNLERNRVWMKWELNFWLCYLSISRCLK